MLLLQAENSTANGPGAAAEAGSREISFVDVRYPDQMPW